MKLTDQQRDLLRLIQRSPDRGQGWRTVSKVLWPIVKGGLPDDLAETIETDDGKGSIRLTPRGQAVLDYL